MRLPFATCQVCPHRYVRKPHGGGVHVGNQAEREGFEPSIPRGIRVFETRALGQLCDLSTRDYSTGRGGSPKTEAL
jgi:hypothetical protein